MWGCFQIIEKMPFYFCPVEENRNEPLLLLMTKVRSTFTKFGLVQKNEEKESIYKIRLIATTQNLAILTMPNVTMSAVRN